MANSIFGIATSGLNAAQAGLLTTSHNIANVNTEGYTRQEIQQSAATPQFSGAGFVGSGVTVESVRRIYSELLEAQLRDSGAQATAAETLAARLASIDDLLARATSPPARRCSAAPKRSPRACAVSRASWTSSAPAATRRSQAR
jgi:flagellar hook-associated protein 1 FlgK